MNKIAFVSLGCPKNLIDSENMLGTLAGAGFDLVADHDEADTVIINTCGFLEAAREESLEVISEAIDRKERGRIGRVVVAGCLVQRHRAKLLEWAPGIDAMIGVFDRDHIIDAVTGKAGNGDVAEKGGALPRYWIAANALQAANERGMKTVGLTVAGADGKGVGYFEDDSNRFRLTPRHWAYLRISEGCNQNCAFCTIPSIRGKIRSKAPEKIIAEARQLMQGGAFELNLIGQDTTSYGYDIGYDGKGEGLVGLLKSLNDVAAEFATASGAGGGNVGGVGGWLRLMYAYPNNFTDEMIEAIADLPNIVKYIDIPLQHASDRMLEKMRRNTTRKQQEELLSKLCDRIPWMAVRTTFITGFPGETEQDHRELLRFIEDFQFDMMGVFQYSPEEGTPAGTMDEDPDLHVPDEVKARREEELMLTQQAIAFETAAYVAEQECMFDVLIDGPADIPTEGEGGTWGGHVYAGRCYHQAPEVDSITYVHSAEPLSPGELVECTIVDSADYDLIARPSVEMERKSSLPVIR
ncbi:MAG: 30S ribosomal protein S12 methylthiotransferase RimO [Phycisphaerales bacterium]|nr:MAG: 30S ribosomal protein S12 methylthiotransferase RimO [Phycisphaerales bacterium]